MSTLKWVGVFILPIFLWSCSNLYKAKQKPGCKEVFDLFKNEWSYDESKKMYMWSMGPMNTGGDLMVKDNAKCFIGLDQRVIRSIMGDPTKVESGTFWKYEYGPKPTPNHQYYFFAYFSENGEVMEVKQVSVEAIFNKK
ncbi:hypothetical protein N9933_03070 [bacterium]|nr:hypothetical protein [bacterium]